MILNLTEGYKFFNEKIVFKRKEYKKNIVETLSNNYKLKFCFVCGFKLPQNEETGCFAICQNCLMKTHYNNSPNIFVGSESKLEFLIELEAFLKGCLENKRTFASWMNIKDAIENISEAKDISHFIKGFEIRDRRKKYNKMCMKIIENKIDIIESQINMNLANYKKAMDSIEFNDAEIFNKMYLNLWEMKIKLQEKYFSISRKGK